MNVNTKEILNILKDTYNVNIDKIDVIENNYPDGSDLIRISESIYNIPNSQKINLEESASYIVNSCDNINDELRKYTETLSDSWLLNGKEIEEDVNVDDEFKEETENPELEEKYTTSQAKILDELSYLISTEYEAIKWYDEAIPMIQSSGMDEDLIVSTILGIEEIRKDEEDHVAHLERLIKQIKENKLIEGTNGNE